LHIPKKPQKKGTTKNTPLAPKKGGEAIMRLPLTVARHLRKCDICQVKWREGGREEETSIKRALTYYVRAKAAKIPPTGIFQLPNRFRSLALTTPPSWRLFAHPPQIEKFNLKTFFKTTKLLKYYDLSQSFHR